MFSVLFLYVLVALTIAVVTAILLALGTVFSLLFAVSVWEATVVVIVVAAGVIWLLASLPPAEEGGPEEFKERPPILWPDLPLPRSRGGKKRRR
ncbi:MAG: hypothetical protein HY347_08970 [candidate division NC10 bacterium]|nr:hypothetical protein [candidate division NC10 bacterium]